MTVEEIRALYEMPGIPDHCFGRQGVGVLLAEIDRLRAGSAKGGRNAAANMTAQQRSERGKRAVAIRWRKRKRPNDDGPKLFGPSGEKT